MKKFFEFFCKDNAKKLIIAPTGDHRGTGMVEQTTQNSKTRPSVLNVGSAGKKHSQNN